MASEVGQTDVQALLERYHVRFEVHPYYIVWEQRPEGAPPVAQRLQAGFDVDLFGPVETMEVPEIHSEEYGTVVHHFEAVARDVQTTVGQLCTVEVIPSWESVLLDTHLRPEAMLRIRISHCRGLDQPQGPAEEEALMAIRNRLRDLGVREP